MRVSLPQASFHLADAWAWYLRLMCTLRSLDPPQLQIPAQVDAANPDRQDAVDELQELLGDRLRDRRQVTPDVRLSTAAPAGQREIGDAFECTSAQLAELLQQR